MFNYKHWVTKQNDTLLIKEMSTEHIQNCIKGIEKTRKSNKKGLPGMFKKDFMRIKGKIYLLVFKHELCKRKKNSIIKIENGR